MNDKKLIELIKKLSNMTTDNGCTEAEALLAASRIAKIKEQYNIDLEKVELEDFEAVGENIETEYKRLPQYLDNLIGHLALAFNCRVVRSFTKERKTYFIVIGLPHDVAMCNHFYRYLSRVLVKESKGRKNKNAFCRGMIHAIMEKLVPKKEDGEKTESQRGVVIYRDAAIKKYMDAKIGKTRKRYAYTKKDDNAYNAGRQRGKGVSLNKPVNGRGQIKIGM